MNEKIPKKYSEEKFSLYEKLPYNRYQKAFVDAFLSCWNLNNLQQLGRNWRNSTVRTCAENWNGRRIPDIENCFAVRGALLRNICSLVGTLRWPSKTLTFVCIMAKCSFLCKFFAFKDKTSNVGSLIDPLDCLSHSSGAHFLQKVNRKFFLWYSYILCLFKFMFEIFLLLWFVTFH